MDVKQHRDVIKELDKKLSIARLAVVKLLDAKNAMQDICDHDYKYIGHGHNFAIYECSVCNKRKEG